MSQSLLQQGGSFSPLNIETIKALYCLPWASAASNQNVYEVTTYLSGIAQSQLYTNETGDTLALTAAQIASLVPWWCNTDYEYTATIVCAAWVTLELRQITINGVSTWASVFYNTVSWAAVATPWVFTYGACVAPKVPATATLNVGLWTVTVPANARREVLIFNKSTRDALIQWTGSTWWAWQIWVPANGTYLLSLTEVPFEWTIASMVIAANVWGIWAIASNQIILDFKN